MSDAKREQMLSKLEDLKKIVEIPKLYVADYFIELRNKVDKEMFSKQMIHKDDNQMKNEISETWKKLISRIDSFEKECINTDKLQLNSNRIDEIRIMLDNINEETNLGIIEDKIQEEELNLFKKIFQNKTIIYEDFFEPQDEEEDDEEEEEEDSHKRLVIIDDEYVNWKIIDKR